MFPCVSFCRAVWWGIQLRWFRLHGFEYSCAEMGETNPKLWSEQRHIHSFAGLLKALTSGLQSNPPSPEQASRLFVKIQRRFLNNKCPAIRTRSTMLECSISCCWPFQLMPSIFCFEDDQDQVRHRTEYCSRVSLNPSMAYCLWWQVLLCTFDLVWTLLLCVRGLCKGIIACGATTKTCCSCPSQCQSLQTAFMQMNL